MVKSITYYADEEFANKIYDSCKDVQSSVAGGPAFGVMCGAWGAELCTPKRLFEYCGSTDNYYVPFKIEYNYGPEIPEGMKLYNTEIIPCNETVDVSSF